VEERGKIEGKCLIIYNEIKKELESVYVRLDVLFLFEARV
jgi:hypothetical protein